MAKRPETARDVLNRLRWGSDENELVNADIVIRHRGAPGDEKVIPGGDIRCLGRGSFETEGAVIPYHRVLRIERKDRPLYARKPREPGT